MNAAPFANTFATNQHELPGAGAVSWHMARKDGWEESGAFFMSKIGLEGWKWVAVVCDVGCEAEKKVVAIRFRQPVENARSHFRRLDTGVAEVRPSCWLKHFSDTMGI